MEKKSKQEHLTLLKNRFELGNSGIIGAGQDEPGVFSAVAVNAKGIAVAGGQILEFGKAGQTKPSESLVIGGLYLQNKGTANSSFKA